MSLSPEVSVEISEVFNFHKDSLPKIEQNIWVKNQWPIVYFIQNRDTLIAYVGESANAIVRIKTHLSNPKRIRELTQISIISSDKFNKSATLDIETNLIQYITAEGIYKLQNGNYGLVNHVYYQRDLYKDLFKDIWKKLIEKKIVSKSLAEIENSELFKYSPYKSLNNEQYASAMSILEGLTNNNTRQIFISGSAGTGKTILATYLVKLLRSDLERELTDELTEEELLEINYIKKFQAKFPNAKVGLVIAMTSLRTSIQNVFRKVPGLSASMVISPSDTFKQNYDLLIVDEAHRLRQYKNIGWRGQFKLNNKKLGLDDKGTELDWIIANSHKQIFFYDADQAVKPSDIDESKFQDLLHNPATLRFQLFSQMRVKGGVDYIDFVEKLLTCKLGTSKKFNPSNYELYTFDSLKKMYEVLETKEKEFGLCRLVAGYSWPWLTQKDMNLTDIEIEGLKFKWNSTNIDWINSKNAFEEIGCIHTTQGYDLNYTGVIFGREINYNSQKGTIEIDSNMYFDINGKIGISNTEDLKNYILNIYKTIMLRGIRGTFIYAYHSELRAYLKEFIKTYNP